MPAISIAGLAVGEFFPEAGSRQITCCNEYLARASNGM
jgi:hypothetical protein